MSVCTNTTASNWANLSEIKYGRDVIIVRTSVNIYCIFCTCTYIDIFISHKLLLIGHCADKICKRNYVLMVIVSVFYYFPAFKVSGLLRLRLAE